MTAADGTVATLDRYLQKAVGRDMMLKAIVYPIRLANYHAKTPETGKILSQLITNIIDARMLSNSWKAISAYLSGYRTLMSSEVMPLYQRVLLALSFFCRMVEQASGDLGYIQAHLIKKWNKPRIVWHYKFWKTMSLTCSAILELIKIINIQTKRRQLHRFVTQTPLTATPSEHPVQFPPKSETNSSSTVDEEESLATAMRWSSLFLFRNICDMTVYYQWMDWYRPNKNIEYVCGFFSGAIGCWLVWRDVSGAAKDPKSPKTKV
eukprot:CAMPEP_0176406600 /NCGR_PEP_ID=MMETSP0127-20121128/962_1 /TAXON_ID=938130 /ORGANISM="Platyophrya macrostoma, Strain WH" /LENGTH=263 /DNA_ID=CAMNT_0017785745 /DNA_START=28 /DNA_END=819 /DNA_ORIENTATION=+